jgi:hypothetical protein
MRTAAPDASVIFQSPETRNRAQSRAAPTQLMALLQPDTSSGARYGSGCAILWSMVPILDRFTVCVRDTVHG